MIALFLFVIGCASTPEKVPYTESKQTPIFIDMDGQNWRYPLSSITPFDDIEHNELKQAQKLYVDEEYTQAAQRLIPYLEQHSEDAIAHSILAACFFRLADLAQAEQAARNAVQYDPNVISYSNLGSILAGKGDLEEAIQAYEKARSYAPKHFLPIRNLVTLYYNNSQLAQAEELLYELIQIDPTDSYGYVSLGQVLVEQNKWKEAEAVYRFRLAELAITPPGERLLAGGLMLDLPLALGNVLLEQKEYTEAEHYFLEMLAQSDTAQSTWTSSNVYKMKAYRGLVYLYMATGEKEKEEDARNQFYALRKKK